MDTLELVDDTKVAAEQSLASFRAQAAVVRGLLDVVEQLLGRAEGADGVVWELIQEMAQLRALLEASTFPPRRGCAPALAATECDSEPAPSTREPEVRPPSVSAVHRVEREVGPASSNHHAAVVFLAHVRAERGDALVDSILLEEPA
jgi:hypothetical protein